MDNSCVNQPLIIRPYRDGDDPDLTKLFRLVFGRTVPESYWVWKFRSFPVNTENQWVAESGGEIVGHYGVTCHRFRFGGREVVVPHGCDAMTHPDHRRRGILTALGRRANSVWQNAGAPFQIGFHYGGWGSVRQRLGWVKVCRQVWVKRWIEPLSSHAQKYGLPGARAWRGLDLVLATILSVQTRAPGSDSDRTGIRLEEVLQADARFDELWEKLSPRFHILAVRNRAWVQWRYLDMPAVEMHLVLATRQDHPLGYIAFRIARDPGTVRAVILDCFTAPGDDLTVHTLLAHAVSVASSSHCRSLAALVIPGSNLFHQLRRNGFWRGRHGFDFSIIPYVPLSAGVKAGNWFLTGAEGDVM